MISVSDYWQRLGLLLLATVYRIWRFDDQIAALEKENKNLKQRCRELTRQVDYQEKNLRAVLEDFEQSALYYLEFRQLAVNFVRAYHHSFIKRRAAISMMVEFLTTHLQMTNQEIYQKEDKEQGLPMKDAVEELKTFLKSLNRNLPGLETSS